jgi:hypothetical protein
VSYATRVGGRAPFLPVSRSRSGARAPSDVPQLQRCLHPLRVSTQLTTRTGRAGGGVAVVLYFAETEFVR